MGRERLFFDQNGYFRVFLALKVHKGSGPDSERMKDEISDIGTCKFEFIKTTITTYIMVFWTNIRKSPKRGVFSPKRAPGAHPRVIPEYR